MMKWFWNKNNEEENIIEKHSFELGDIRFFLQRLEIGKPLNFLPGLNTWAIYLSRRVDKELGLLIATCSGIHGVQIDAGSYGCVVQIAPTFEEYTVLASVCYKIAAEEEKHEPDQQKDIVH